MPRFVLLYHQCSAGYEKPSHWDFMLEWTESLRTWELQELPASWHEVLSGRMRAEDRSTPSVVVARRLPDHRLAYLDYEGPLSGNRGRVSCCDAGTYTMIRETKDRLEIQLAGNRLQGKISLELDTEHKDQWRLVGPLSGGR